MSKEQDWGEGGKNLPENPTILHNFQYTANMSGISILIEKMPLAVLFIYGMSYSFHSCLLGNSTLNLDFLLI